MEVELVGSSASDMGEQRRAATYAAAGKGRESEGDQMIGPSNIECGVKAWLLLLSAAGATAAAESIGHSGQAVHHHGNHTSHAIPRLCRLGQRIREVVRSMREEAGSDLRSSENQQNAENCQCVRANIRTRCTAL